MNFQQLMLLEVLTETPQEQREIQKLLAQKELKISTRHIRAIMKSINELFIDGEIDFLIISNHDGSYISRNEKEIHEFNAKKRSHALSELRSLYQTNKRLNLNKNMTWEEYLREEENHERTN